MQREPAVSPASVRRRRETTSGAAPLPRVVLHLPDLRAPVPVPQAEAAPAPEVAPQGPRNGHAIPHTAPVETPPTEHVDAGWDDELRFWKKALDQTPLGSLFSVMQRNPAVTLLIVGLMAVQLITVVALIQPEGSAKPTTDSALTAPRVELPTPTPASETPVAPSQTATRTTPAPQPAAPPVLAPQLTAPALPAPSHPLNELPAWDESAYRSAYPASGPMGPPGPQTPGGVFPELQTAARPQSAYTTPPVARLRGNIDPSQTSTPGIR